MPRLLRAIAITIAIAAAIDPAITTRRTTRPDIAVIAADATRDSALAARVARVIGKSFTVTPAQFAAAGATIVVGDRIPDARMTDGPVFAVTADHDRAEASIENVAVPQWTQLGARVPVGADVRIVHGVNGGGSVTLSANGVVVATQASDASGETQNTPYHLEFTPARPGITTLHLSAIASRGARRADSSMADVAVDVRDHVWSVLFYDPRPSWLSTFVRRSVEADDRFAVTSRVVTSRNVSTDAGRPPGTLEDDAALDGYDAIVVGAPDALSERDVAGIERYLRRRGGSVLLLLDQQATGPWQRLTGVSRWLDNSSGRLLSVVPTGGDRMLRGAEFTWPLHLPPGADVVAYTQPDSARDSSAAHPVIWRSPVGAGQLTVSGALDSWRYRDSSIARFDEFWRSTIATAAESAIPPVAVTLTHSVARPGEWITVAVSVRSATLHDLPAGTSVTGTIESDTGAVRYSITLWPGESPGELRGTFRAPERSGAYRIAISADGHRAAAPLVVAVGTMHPSASTAELLSAWTIAHGGRMIGESQLDQLAPLLRAVIKPVPRAERWHPLRSPWWLLPFVVVLSGEWWLRRRRGLA